MSIRRSVRAAMKSGTALYATVEEVNLGLATVRLGATGARLTNLSTVGGQVQKGDTVIVDYSAGINPIVRPLFLEDEPEELEPGVSAPEVTVDDEDLSTFQWTWYNYDTYHYLYQNSPFQLHGGDYNYWDEPYYGESWDSCNMCANTARFEDGSVTIPRDGLYFIAMSWLEDFEFTKAEGTGEQQYDYIESSYYSRAQILRNGTPIAEGTGQWFVGWYGETSIHFSTIEYCDAGDKITFEIYFTSSQLNALLFDNWGFFEENGRARQVIYIPGT